MVGRRGLTDKSVDFRSRRQGTGDQIPVENNQVKKKFIVITAHHVQVWSMAGRSISST